MPEFSIKYQTKNNYSPDMRHAQIEFLLFPETNDSQEIIDYQILTKPGVREHNSRNSFGFKTFQFRLDKNHLQFELTLTARVKKDRLNPFEMNQLSYEEEQAILESVDFAVDNYPFCSKTSLTTVPDDFYYPVIDAGERVFEFVIRVNKFIFEELNYSDDDANPQKTIAQTLEDRFGVCQDYAHFMLAILRKNKIPARYVSGYLNPGSHNTGTGAIHAWVQALIPGVGWIGFDPTNKLLEDYHYIKIAHGVDINDCHNVKGVVVGPGTNNTRYSVSVEEQNLKQDQ